MRTQTIINVILSLVLALYFILLAASVAVPVWLYWVYGIAAIIALILSFMKGK